MLRKGVCIMNMELIMQALEVMWKGMLSIFTVIIILTILVYVLNKILKDWEKNRQSYSRLNEIPRRRRWRGIFFDGLYIYAVFYFSANQLISACNLF